MLIGIAACAIAARIYLRLKIQKRRLIISDFLMIMAWFSSCTGASFGIVLVVKGVLKPENDWFLSNLNIDLQTSVAEPERMCGVAVVATASRIAWVLHIVGSIMLFILPFSILHNLQMPMRLKISVCSVFLLGLVDIAFSFARFFTIQLSREGEFRSMTLIELWGALDIYIGLVIACLPSLRPYFRPNFGTSSYDQSKKLCGGSVPLRLRNQSGFQEIDDGLYTGARVASGQETGGSLALPDLAADDAWNRESNRSDVELVQIAARPPTKALIPM
ncbi:hypothetical protein ACJZ2D_011497 [Fusarium nematophilum]